MKFDSIINKVNSILTEAPGNEQQQSANNADKTVADAQVAPAAGNRDAAVPDPGADDDAQQQQSQLQEAEKTVINILIDISTVLRDYLSANESKTPGSVEKINLLSELINKTRGELGNNTSDAVQILGDFATSFSEIFREHFTTS